ncbi:glycosyltransferase [Algoriphagus resistens]|uniref:glycosyltransferase n=1 Tax=Algoriphagus resistens TaxID=1750590 RepID=UPI0007168086|nr:glycosyltransferase [Algoriphagus resistens]
MMTKPILFVINSLRLGGAEKICVELANAFVQQGIPVDLVVLELREAVLRENLDPKVRLTNLEIGHARQAFFSLKKLIQAGDYTQTLVFTFQLSVVLVLIRKLSGLRFRIIARAINNLTEKFKHERSLWHKYASYFLIRQFYFDVDHIIAQSSGMHRELEKLRGGRKTGISTIFNFHQIRPLNNLIGTASLDGLQSQNKLLFVGKLKLQKNVSFLLKVAGELARTRQDFHFTIVGDGPEKESLLQLRGELGLADNVTLVGAQKEVAPFYAKTSVLVLGSWYEGFPNVLLEALEFGIPIVSVNCPSGPEDIIINEVNGKLVNGYDVGEFAKAVTETLHRKWNKEVIRSTLKRFSKDTAVQSYLDLLTEKKDSGAAKT